MNLNKRITNNLHKTILQGQVKGVKKELDSLLKQSEALTEKIKAMIKAFEDLEGDK